MERNKSDTERGQVGIGTLIVFIAMVLVAAIAAGVLINTAGFLQTQAEDTGTESTEQVADSLNVITEVGNVSANDEINEVRVGVQPAAGANDINLAKLTIQYVSDNNSFANLIIANETGAEEPAEGDVSPGELALSDTDVANAQYLVSVTKAENENDLVMTDNSDRYELVIPLAVEAVGSNQQEGSLPGEFGQDGLGILDEGESVELKITTEVGSQSVAFLQVPDSLSGEDPDETVNL